MTHPLGCPVDDAMKINFQKFAVYFSVYTLFAVSDMREKSVFQEGFPPGKLPGKIYFRVLTRWCKIILGEYAG